jgi:diguanylate cyclase (GGDEF)-like protein
MMQRKTLLALAAVVLAAGAPLGLLLLRAGLSWTAPDPGWISNQLRADLPLYLYLWLSTSSVMLGFALLTGHYRERLNVISNTDALTGLASRRRFTEALEREVARSLRYGAPLTLLLIDVDQFKRVNDQFGHAAGDRALGRVADSLRSTCRQTDLPARYGGDEFALLLPETTGEKGLQLAQRIAVALRDPALEGPEDPPLTLSIGVAQLAPGERVAALARRADQGLYQAKSSGRNRAILAPGGAPSSARSSVAPPP